LNGAAFGGVTEKLGIRQNHSAHGHEVDPAFAKNSLGDVGKKILEITVSSANDDELWELRFQLTGHL